MPQCDNARSGILISVWLDRDRQMTGKMRLRGDRIRAARRLLGLRQPEMAEIVGLSLSAYSRMERGKNTEFPTADVFLKVCDRLKISFRYALGVVDQPEIPQHLAKDEAEWLALYRARTPDGRKAALEAFKEGQEAFDAMKETRRAP